MLIRKKLPRAHGLNEPILHADHRRPVTRRDFIASGLLTGPAVVAAGSLLALLAKSPLARAELSQHMKDLKGPLGCNIQGGAGRIPFICFDLAGGANLCGSEILIGGKGGQLDFLSTAGYARLGLPGDMVPNAPNAASPTNNFINTAFGAAFHSDGAILRGMLERTSPTTQALTNGCAIAARSENDTSNNPHNPMYGIMRTGSRGELLGLIGSQSSDSGGNSVAPMSMIDLSNRPTKVDRASDVTGLVDTGDLAKLLPPAQVPAVLEAMTALTGGTADPASIDPNSKLGKIVFGTGANDANIEKAVRCGYVKSAYLADTFNNPAALNPDLDPDIVDQSATRGSGIFGQAEYQADGEFRKTAAIMKMVVSGFAGAGTITMGGYDYHTGNRADGEQRNLRAGRCIGACLEYAARKGVPLMVYVFSDGSLSAMSTVDNSANGRGKFAWQGDNQATANSFFLVFSPKGRPVALSPDPAGGLGKQIGYFRADGSVETASHPGANAVNLLVETVVLNYMALHGEAGKFTDPDKFPNQGLGSPTMRDSLTAFAPII
ncbi:MAG TPA: hypothetical protein VFS52_20815 [Steroidobacteraceae bacterium]|nr:hypothetical protein [Steroidobacteraceae bacterium]